MPCGVGTDGVSEASAARVGIRRIQSMINFKGSLRTIAGVTMFASTMLGIAATASAEGTAATTNAAATATAATATAATATAAPSGEAMPVGNLPGWKQIFSDDFATDVPLGQFPA